jgi:SsrA-binding protein
MKTISNNKKAFHDYEISQRFSAGIVLTGDEIKSIRKGNISLKESFAHIRGGEVYLVNSYIAPYENAYSKKYEPRRSRKLLLQRGEINRIIGDISKKGLTLIPLKIFLNARGYAKIDIGLAKHKNQSNKKRQLREKDIKREAEREVKVRIG